MNECSRKRLVTSPSRTHPTATSALHSTLAQTCFSLCFAENCILFMILMFQGLDLMDPSSRMLNWRFSLFLLLSTILLLVPISPLSSASSIATAEHALDRVRTDLGDRTREVDNYQPPPQNQSASWVSRIAPFNRDSQLSSLKQEVIGLQALESEMSTRLSTLKSNQSAARFAHSFHGKLLTRIWAVYCVGRVCKTSPSSYGDIIAHLLAYIFSLLSSEGYDDVGKLKVDVPSLSRQISLALVGIIILSSVRVVLRGVTRALRITSRHLSASLMLLTLAQLMGIYLLSTLVQLRTAFPPFTTPPPSSDDGQFPTADDSTNVFTTLPAYSLFGVLFDWSFLLGAGACALGKWAGGILSGDDM
ncbi:hypothetical protein SERLA73DRAFT_125570 [Serpula lacrymans var. lacrymans S7.3]|uniref:Abscisic acid G-protein coupled receptor-like domain-containing protein n=1 Tax=Serpula lacrymans var. lacrymans (strain S7.3) TaxID=936435 RepID=F8QA43_SERL3|nr:hypothetical protein SERLA73DRAFT_125570 [Serpula lacrymans var. lacrymans S7.3]